MPPGRSSLGGRNLPRKSHRKSRLGCKNCKQRRIKCDEQKPSCTNCIKHSIPCDYNTNNAGPAAAPRLLASRPITPAATGTSTPPTPFPGSPSNNNLNIPLYTTTELELLHNYYISTAPSLSSNPALSHFWRADVPKLSFSWPCLLNGLFSISALHLARFRPESRDTYLAQADVYWDRALRSATPLLEAINDANYHAVYVFSILAAFYLLGKGPRADDDDFLAFDGQLSAAGTLLHIRSTRVIIESADSEAALRNGPVAVLFDVGMRHIARWLLPDRENEHALVQELRFIHAYLEPEDESDVYVNEIDNLSRSFHAVAAERASSGGGGGGVSTQVVFVWLYKLSDEFLDCLRQREPMALTIFAYFVVLLKELEGAWYLQGWVEHLIAGIYHALGPGTRTWVRTPIERVGWIPPV
ncbi:putative c6 zinc finger protein [Lasiodiplodia theobromae]|uniref:C6 zinc finger protein n=1 Tax=Lasiodiplodia theobromae TaxID=45133 RepID=A0A8H7IRG8_9PEZI|nr:C6 zinc finger domain-containing protein [Lasiodiplodia theobromae]KAF4546215.1 C6 zinc finger domain-containing protein [Lasiodiplodia theobromae]KAF9630403.1 putative c6 zinc finger protein [Lasiodiplodia theobromae]